MVFIAIPYLGPAHDLFWSYLGRLLNFSDRLGTDSAVSLTSVAFSINLFLLKRKDAEGGNEGAERASDKCEEVTVQQEEKTLSHI